MVAYTETAGIDKKAYDDAEAAFRLTQQTLPPDLVLGVAQEVVRRLAFRMPGVTPSDNYPDAAKIETLCRALLADDEIAADQIIMDAQRDGADIETIYLGYIAGASKRLGEMWEHDEVSFIDVSLGTGRLYRIIRGLRHAIAPVVLEGRSRMPAMFALVPGETHNLGIEVAADLFRRDGGDVDVCLTLSHDEIVARAERHHFGAIVLVANSDRVIPALIQLAVALRIALPLTPLALAGNLVDQTPDAAKMIEADLVISDIHAAIPTLREMTQQHKATTS